MRIIDLHTDTLTRQRIGKLDDNVEYIYSNKDRHLDLLRAKKSGYSLWGTACFLKMPEGELKSKALQYFQILDRLAEKHHDECALFTSYDEYIKNSNEGKVTLFKTIEEGEIFEGKLENVHKFANLGVKMATLTWNYPNSLAWPNYPRPDLNAPELTFGLTNIGKVLVREMERYKMIVDVSHLGDKAFYDLVDNYHGVIVASHSNARSINPSVRNLTDEMIKIIAQSGGVVGLNLCEYFVKVSDNYMLDLVKHLNHIRKVGGIDVCALGSDFDGIDTPPLLTDCTKWNILLEALKIDGWCEEDIEKLTHKNFERVLQTL